jgi:hypothetical protein
MFMTTKRGWLLPPVPAPFSGRQAVIIGRAFRLRNQQSRAAWRIRETHYFTADNPRRGGHMLQLAAFSGVLVVLGSIYQSITSLDPHWVQRGGALLTAIAASLAIFDAFVEHKVRLGEVSKPDRPNGMVGEDGVAIGLLNRIRQAKFRSRYTSLSSEKLRTVFLISCIAVFGELLHGFGDLFILEIGGALGLKFVTHGL